MGSAEVGRSSKPSRCAVARDGKGVKEQREPPRRATLEDAMKDVAECAFAETSKVAGATLEDALDSVKVGKALAQQTDCSMKLAE